MYFPLRRSVLYPYLYCMLLRLAAWATHAFTASGIFVGYLALDRFAHGEEANAFRDGWLYLLLALVIDGVDGTFARLFKVKTVLPQMDGGMIDAVVDFATYALIPVFFVHQAGLLPEGSWGYLGVAAMLITSAVYYGKQGMVSSDLYFVGFPVLWNLVGFYLYFVFHWPVWVNLGVVVILSGMHFVPIKFLYPSRARRFFVLHLVMVVVFGLSILGVLLLPKGELYMVAHGGSVGTLVYLGGMSVVETFWGGKA